MDKPRKDNRGLIIPKTIIFTLKILDFISPYLCMRFAGYLWTKPLKYKILKREIPIIKSSKISTVKIKEISKEIKLYRWKGKGPKILLVHGWSGRATSMYFIIEKLIENNYDVYSFDAPAHGNSPTSTSNIPEFIACIKELSSSIKSFNGIIGHSGGAFASIYYSSIYKNKLKKLVLISPFNSVYELFHGFFKQINVSKKVGDLMISFYSKKTGIMIDEDLSVHKFARLLKSETLIIHDENDKEISIQNSKLIKSNIKNIQAYFTKGLGHRRILRNESVTKKILDFLQEDMPVI